MSPADFARTYANLNAWQYVGGSSSPESAWIRKYLQDGKGAQSSRADMAKGRFYEALKKATGVQYRDSTRSFRFKGYDYISASIRRCFMGKACPWEIQETVQLGSQIGIFDEVRVKDYCDQNLGVDCGGFVANYWGEACPHMDETAPEGWNGIAPRTFWASEHFFPGVMGRRRKSVSQIKAGDAAIFFEGNLADPDKLDQKKSGEWTGVGSRAFHIGLVGAPIAETATTLPIVDASGSRSSFGSDGVNIRELSFKAFGSFRGWVRCETESNHIYFVGPPSGWGPEDGYKIP